MVYMGNYWRRQKEEALIERMRVEKSLYAPRAFSMITDDDLATFKGVFIPGGHAPLTDLGADPDLGRILLHFHKASKPTGTSWYILAPEKMLMVHLATVCHGPFAFLSTQVAPGSDGFAYKGYKITSWSDTEEKVIEGLKGGHIQMVESSLRDAGADMQTQFNKKMGNITVDREVVSGANPLAVNALGDKFVEMLAQRESGKQIESLEKNNAFPGSAN
jgi:putative intracellular protease/amidase